MFDDVDQTLRKLISMGFPAPLPFDISFALPDKNFKPLSGDKATLNCYLYEIRENRELRQVDPILTRNSDGTIEKTYAPARVRVAYCITAWSPVQPSPALEPAIEEHKLLGQVLAQLLKYPNVPPEALQGTLAGQDPLLPTTVVLPEDMKTNRDFWNAVGGALRPALDYSITASLAYQDPTSGPMMTAASLGVGEIPRPATAGFGLGKAPAAYLIGGIVRDSASPPAVISGVWVRVQETGQTDVTDQDGQFRIDRLSPGSYTLTARAAGFHDGSLPVKVPQPNGRYDIQLIPL